jgi:type II secretory pathway predicted ATPase ExeA
VLAGEAAERGRTPDLIIGEAHLPDHDQPESIRMLTNHDMDNKTPSATVPPGQPTLRPMIKPGVPAAPDQRIAVRHQMTGMTPAQNDSHIRHHLQLAGRDGELLSDDATAQIHQAARRKPRAVNNPATAAPIATYTAAKKIAGQTAARAAITALTATE